MLLLRAFIILVKLLTVEECFVLSSLGLVITPHFPMPKDRWENFSAPIIIEQPHGHQIKAEGHFYLTHFNIPDTQASLDQRWQVALAIKKSVTKNHIPKGSIILIAEVDAHKILFGNDIAVPIYAFTVLACSNYKFRPPVPSKQGLEYAQLVAL